MGRFLIYFSYFGTRYSGLQIQKQLVKGTPRLTVQNALQDALKRLRPSNEIKIILSSRTDKGVHSLKNACHVDLVYPKEGREYDPEVITKVMNYGLENNHHDVRVLETLRVNSSFHARLRARERKYVYRLAHTVKNVKSEEERKALATEFKKYFMPRHKYPRLPSNEVLPIADTYKVKVFRNTLDMSKLISAAEACSGIHDYSSFTRPVKFPDYKPHPVKMLSIGIKRGRPFGHTLNDIGHKTSEDLEYWDIHVRSSSFMYKQVRRLVGGLVLVAKNSIRLEDLKDILDNPGVDFKFAGQMGMDECGLFLVDVVYNPEDLRFDETSCENASTDAPPLTHSDTDCQLESSSSRTECTDGEDETQSDKICDQDRNTKGFIRTDR